MDAEDGQQGVVQGHPRKGGGMLTFDFDLTLGQLALQAGILLFCAFIQSTVGFAFSLFSNSLLLLIGLALPQTVILSTLGSTLQRLLMTSSMRRHVDWRQTLPMSGVCLLTLPLGILVLKVFSEQSVGFAKVSLGLLILMILAVQKFANVRPREKLHRGWGALAAAASGILTGLANIGGPPLLLWVHAHKWTNEKTRVTVMAITTTLVPVQLVLMLRVFGGDVFPSMAQLMLLAPAIAIGTLAGMAAGKRLSRPRLRTVALTLLVVICALLILEPIR